MALAFRSSPEIKTVSDAWAFDPTAFDHGVVWFERRSASDDIELPRRAASYLMKRGLSRDAAASAIEAEFGLSPRAAESLAAKASM